jgi:hypothetical protein
MQQMEVQTVAARLADAFNTASEAAGLTKKVIFPLVTVLSVQDEKSRWVFQKESHILSVMCETD